MIVAMSGVFDDRPSLQEVGVRHIKAACACGETRFHAPQTPPYAARARFVCIACGKATPYGDLLDQIGDCAVRQARESLKRLRGNGAPRPAPLTWRSGEPAAGK